MKYINSNSGPVISDDVIATIAINAAKDVEGVTDIGNKPNDIKSYCPFSDSENLRHVKVTRFDNDIKLHMYIILDSTSKIQDVTAKVQSAVKSAVQSMTGQIVTKVDVTVSGISIVSEPKEV